MYRFEKNPETGTSEMVIDGWENGIAPSPYQGITSIKNLNIRYLPSAVYSNYKRLLNSPSSGIGLPKYSTFNPTTNIYYIVDSNGLVWQSQDATTTWTQLTGNAGHTGGGQGLAVYKSFLFVFKDSTIDYVDLLNFNTWTFDWQTGLQSGVDHMAFWNQDDILYFCNGQPPSTAGSSIGSIQPADVTIPFDPQTNVTYNPSAVLLPGYEQSATWLVNLGTNLVIAAGKTLYPVDLSTSTGLTVVSASTAFIQETIYKVINIMNNLYVTAGVKGNIYISNGYSISPFVKIPDSFFGVIDPALVPGGLMAHRNKLYVGFSQVNSPFLNGVFSISLQLNPYGTSEVAGAINFENQNSYGLNATGVTAPYGQPNILIDVETASIDTYVSAWFDGTKGGMDTNNNTLYTGGETIIETDLIPVGTFLVPKTFLDIEFKLDEPMQVNDTITIYARQSFSGSYVEMGTTTSNVLSDVYTPLVLEKFQWAQFKIVLIPGASTHFIRLREIRIR